MRAINLNFDQQELEQVAKALYALGSEDHMLEKAIGYLSTWGLSYPFVDIYISNSKEAEFTACYRSKVYELGDKTNFVLGAVFNKQTKKYGFHS